MNITPVSQTAYNSKNQKTPNFKATIVSKLARNASDADVDKYCSRLRNLILANLPIKDSSEFYLHLEGNKVMAPVDDDSLFNQAGEFVDRLSKHLKGQTKRFGKVKVDLDWRNLEDIADPNPF